MMIRLWNPELRTEPKRYCKWRSKRERKETEEMTERD